MVSKSLREIAVEVAKIGENILLHDPKSGRRLIELGKMLEEINPGLIIPADQIEPAEKRFGSPDYPDDPFDGNCADGTPIFR